VFQLAEVQFPELAHFESDDEAAVGQVPVAGEILLMIVFGHEEGLKRHHLGHYRIIPHLGRRLFLDHLLGNPFLLLVLVKDGRPVLGADVGPLAI